MGVIISDYMKSYTYEGYRSDQYSSLWKIDEADPVAPSEAQRSGRLAKFVVMITRA